MLVGANANAIELGSGNVVHPVAEQALASLEAGKGRSLEEVRQAIRTASAKRR